MSLEPRWNSPNKLFLREFFVALFMFKFFCTAKAGYFSKFYQRRATRKIFVTTRAPYKNKLTRNHYLLQRYRHTLFLKIPFSTSPILNEMLDQANVIKYYLEHLDFAHLAVKSIKLKLSLPINFSEENGSV